MSEWTNCICPSLQASLNEVAGNNAPALRRDRVGLVEALMSPANKAGFEAIPIDPKNGKEKSVRVNYYQRLTEDTVNESLTDTCDSGTEHAPLCDTITLTKALETDNLVFDEDNMRKLCAPLGETDEVWRSRIIMAQMNALLTKLNKNLHALLKINKGTFMDGSTIKNIQLFNTFGDDGAGARQFAIANILNEFEEAGLAGTPMVIGSGDLNLYYKALGIGSVNLYGADLSKLNGETAYFYDRFVPSVWGVNEFVALAPGVAQLLTWNRYVGEYAKKTPTFEHGTIVDPFTGLTFDLKMHYDDCKDTYYLKLQLVYDLWTVPDDAEDSSGDFYGVNGIFNYKICDGIDECAGESVSEASLS